eukprot:11174420-Alexandrium_andersonii.AAC.1
MEALRFMLQHMLAHPLSLRASSSRISARNPKQLVWVVVYHTANALVVCGQQAVRSHNNELPHLLSEVQRHSTQQGLPSLATSQTSEFIPDSLRKQGALKHRTHAETNIQLQ